MNHLITAFIAARLDDDEAAVRRNLGTDGLGDNGCFPDYRTYSDADTDAADDFLDRFRPPRMLREVKAKRLLLRMLISALLDDPADETAQHQVRVLAAIYSDHVDWQEEWQPDVY